MAKKRTARLGTKSVRIIVEGNRITGVDELAQEKRAATGPNNLATLLWDLSPRILDQIGNMDFPYASHPVVFAGIEAIIRNLLTVPLLVRQGDRRNSKASRIVESGPWKNLFGKPCPYLSEKQFLRVLMVWYDHIGDVKMVRTDKNGAVVSSPTEIPASLYPYSGRKFSPVIKDDRFTGWRYDGGVIFGLQEFAPWQILQFHRPDPREPWKGIGVEDAAGVTTRSDIKAMVFDEKFFDNGCVFSGVITADHLTQDQIDMIHRQKRDEHGGFKKAFKMLTLAGQNVKYTPMSATHHDMQFQEKRRFSREEILMARGVSEKDLGIGSDANIITGQGVQSGNKQFWTASVIPLMAEFEDAVYEWLMKPIDPTVFIEWDRNSIMALRGDLNQKLDSGAKLMGQGWTSNEVNEALDYGMPAITDGSGDIRYVAAGLQPLDALLMDDLEMPEAGEEDETEPKDDEPVADDEGDGEKPETEEEKGVVKVVRANLDWLAEDQGRQLTVEQMRDARLRVRSFLSRQSKKRAQAWRRIMKKVMLPMEAKFRRAMGAYLYALRAEQLKRLSKLDVKRMAGEILDAVPAMVKAGHFEDGANGLVAELARYECGDAVLAIDARDTIDQILFPSEKWKGNLYKATEPVYFDVIQRATDDVFGELGGNFAFDITDPRVIDIVEKRQKVNLARVTDTIRRQVARTIEKNVRDGASIREVQESVRKQFDFAASRALTISRTEVGGATNQARNEVMREEGVEGTSWTTAADEAVRASHESQDGVIVKIGQAFPNGQEFPGDTNGVDASEYVSCRCVATPA